MIVMLSRARQVVADRDGERVARPQLERLTGFRERPPRLIGHGPRTRAYGDRAVVTERDNPTQLLTALTDQ